MRFDLTKKLSEDKYSRYVSLGLNEHYERFELDIRRWEVDNNRLLSDCKTDIDRLMLDYSPNQVTENQSLLIGEELCGIVEYNPTSNIPYVLPHFCLERKPDKSIEKIGERVQKGKFILGDKTIPIYASKVLDISFGARFNLEVADFDEATGLLISAAEAGYKISF
tara:strand:+ start:32 stop:529 length:498 start_codon:yes stop_codon:yes gene_type:complete